LGKAIWKISREKIKESYVKVILEPKVTVVSKVNFLEHPEYKVPDDGDNFTRLGAFAAKGCYDSFGEEGRANEDNQSAILEYRHGSVLEHLNITLFIEGITRGLSLELNRHRMFSISQRSTRYVAEEESAIVLEPYFAQLFRELEPKIDRYSNRFRAASYPSPMEILRSREEVGGVDNAIAQKLQKSRLLLQHLNSQCESISKYEQQVEELMIMNPYELEKFDLRKWARGKARNLLPHGIETRGTYTSNIRGWRWFIEARSESNAETEIRSLANKVLLALREIAPLYFEDFESWEDHEDIPEWKPTHSKV